ncbi:MAG: domain S-box protein, partial [Anaerolineales bacterium]|nr:domain S-box protein [Anaerolineales bacterium]
MTKEKRRHVDGVPSAEATGSPQAGSGPALRRRAETIAREKAARSPEDLEALSPEEIRRTLHELRVHQIELEMQNDELRRAQEELGASRSKYSDLYDMAPVGYFTVGEEGVILQANLRGADLLGVERSRLIKQPLGRFIVPEDNDVYYLHCKRVLEKVARQACELRMCRKDGSPFRGRLETSATRDGMDGPPVFRIILSDITERMRAEEALQQSEERYRAMVEGLPDVVMRFDNEGRHLFVSENVRQVVDLQAEQFIGKTHHELGYPEAQCRFWVEAVQGVFNAVTPFETEFTLDGKQG